MLMAPDVKKRLRQGVEAFGSANDATFWDLLHEHVVWTWYGPVAEGGSVTLQGRQAIRASMQQTPFRDDMRTVVEHMVAEGASITVLGRVEATEQSGRPYRCAYADLYRFEGELVAEVRSYICELA